jgi:hypothetical protein
LTFEIRRYTEADRSEGLKPVLEFAHYNGNDREQVRRRFKRVHDDVLFERAV